MSQLSLFGEGFLPEPIVELPVKPRRKPSARKHPTERANPPVEKVEVSVAVLNGWQADKQYYTIGEVASLFNVNTSHIRFWTKEFHLKVRTTRKGDRLYKPEDIRELATIYHLVKERGFTLAGARAVLKEEKKKLERELSLQTSLETLKKQLLTLKSQLEQVRKI